MSRRLRAPLPSKSFVAIVAAILTTFLITFLSWRSLQSRTESVAVAMHTTTTRYDINRLLISLERAHAGQRGYLLTLDPSFLKTYETSIANITANLTRLRLQLAKSPRQLQQLSVFEGVWATRQQLLAETIELAGAQKLDEAVAIVRTGSGRALTEHLRELGAEMLQVVQGELDADETKRSSAAAWSTYVTVGGSGVLLAMLLLVGALASRDFRTVQAEGWVRQLQSDLGSRIQGDFRVDSLGDKVLQTLVHGVDAQVGAFYVNGPDGLSRVAGHSLPGDSPQHFKRGEALVGQALIEQRLRHLKDVPAGYLAVKSATGTTTPRQVIIAPAIAEGEVHGVVELGFLRELDSVDVDALERISEVIGVAVRAARDRGKLEALLEMTQRQAEELQTQQEELRVTNEELEQQSRALQLSQTQLENQQSELEQINAQLEEQTSSLERQRDQLAHTGTELQRASAYKSQFLANMSHELRTPLNSSLILAKLLADNREGNLTTEQVQFASTIYSAGNDLLVLINDILDLSKIEAGMLDVRNEPIVLRRLVSDLQNTFAPLANQKQLALELDVAADVPELFDTDQTRLQQIVRNLLSNAIKFTEQGGVTLTITTRGEHIVLSVRDTGIGIPPDQHETIFEAFRQADGATNRKYGGTGLGLTISRDLARLLGGDLVVQSVPGRGSTFELALPRRAPKLLARPSPRAATAAPNVVEQPERARAPADLLRSVAARPPQTHTIGPGPFDDDRTKLGKGSRTLLIVEDDVAFARVLYDLAHELEFNAVVATTGEDGIALARDLAPSAIVLDISLPDRSGLAVLDTLKRDSRTRHVPVHVISAHDYTRTALEMGAAGYALKPIERDRLVDALKRLEERITRKLRRVLVVEDDPLLRESTARLLRADDVEMVTAGTTAEALEHVRTMTFDCMVLDLSLPDRSGIELLEDMARGEQYSFPPVIVYTGRPLTSEQVHQLERFSRSIIIKGAKSPERLLDEVALFLHQVESKLPPDRQRMIMTARDREASFEGKRVMIVEDDVRNVFALSAALEPKGAQIAIARNGREALAYLRSNPAVDLVLMDIMMPEMDGLEATRELRKDPRFTRLPIIALTAKAMADDRDRCLEAGANDYIAKPIDVDKLLSLARVWIRK